MLAHISLIAVKHVKYFTLECSKEEKAFYEP